MTPPLVKICGLTRAEDVDAAVECGADLVGFVLAEASPRRVSRAGLAALRARVPAGVGAVAVCVDEPLAAVQALLDELELAFVQLHGDEPEAEVRALGDRAIKAFRLPHAGPLYGDPLLLDRGFDSHPTQAELAAHWQTARDLSAGGRRILLAGALDSDNVADAVASARPWAVDVARGTESAPGIKDHDRMRAFVRNAKEASQR